jgi:hypothetical protein
MTELSVKEWHERLHAHFRSVREARAPQWPLFALEHGLSADDVADLSSKLRTSVSETVPSDAYWLPWLVYGAEIGYKYEGDEYWQTFQEQTPGWREHGDRYWLQGIFIRFFRAYGGAKPEGTWASHFTLICWPITHAVLPTYLQRQLARLLYELRYSFSASLLQSPESLGAHIASNAFDESRRFQEFAQNRLLLGQIAVALLTSEDTQTKVLLLPSTLERIVKDLERERSARDWLRNARAQAHQIAVDGLARSRTGPGRPTTGESDSQRDLRSIEPSLLLRPGRSGWQVLVEIPDFAPLVDLNPSFREILTHSRCTVRGSNQRLARQQLLSYGSQRVLLHSWPKPSEPLLEFRPAPPAEFQQLLVECSLRPGPTWLCRLTSDGQAIQISGLTVHPGKTYIVLSESSPLLGKLGQPLTIECKGISASMITLPDAVSSEAEMQIARLGLRLIRHFRIWPAGSPACSWDGEGHIEWLAGEVPYLGIQADHWLGDLRVVLDETDILTLEKLEPGIARFLRLPLLPSGGHRLSLYARRGKYPEFEPIGELDVLVREARRWTRGANSQGALIVFVDPPEPSLENLLDAHVGLEVHGPLTRSVEVSIELLQIGTDTPALIWKRPPVALPIGVEKWSQLLREFVAEVSDNKALDISNACRISVDGEELGRFILTCERDHSPLRWIVKESSRSYTVSLLDAPSEDSQVYYYSFKEPCDSISLDEKVVAQNYTVPTKGGLFVARTIHECRGVVIPHLVSNISDLAKEEPTMPSLHRSERGVLELLYSIDLWSRARAVDPFSRWSRRNVQHYLLTHLFGLIGGNNWLVAEQHYHQNLSNEGALRYLSRAIAVKSSEKNVESVLTGALSSLKGKDASPKSYVTFLAERLKPLIQIEERGQQLPTKDLPARLAPRFRRGLHRYVEFSLRLASEPHTVRSWAKTWFDKAIQQVLQTPILARAARFVVLAVDFENRRNGYGGQTSLYASWDWESDDDETDNEG